MKTIITFLICTGFCFAANAQDRIRDYKASNGVTYHEGDTIRIGRGVGMNGKFVYVQFSSILRKSRDRTATNGAPAVMSGSIVTIIDLKKLSAGKIVFHTKNIDGIGYNVHIEDAIATCEVRACGKNQTSTAGDKYDKIRKLKELLDAGALTQAEFDSEKAKLLAEN